MRFDRIDKLSAREWQRANLENDTEERRESLKRRGDPGGPGSAGRGEEQSEFYELNTAKAEEAEVFGETEAEGAGAERIKHQSLILAQDERWRRA